jgi:hypothetical protein
MNNGGPAFPTGTAFQGMTLRDYFAAKAMQGLTANSTNPKEIAQAAYIVADAMLEARKK